MPVLIAEQMHFVEDLLVGWRMCSVASSLLALLSRLCQQHYYLWKIALDRDHFGIKLLLVIFCAELRLAAKAAWCGVPLATAPSLVMAISGRDSTHASF